MEGVAKLELNALAEVPDGSGRSPELSPASMVEAKEEGDGSGVKPTPPEEAGLLFLSHFTSDAILKIAGAHGIKPGVLELGESQSRMLLAGMHVADSRSLMAKLSSAIGVDQAVIMNLGNDVVSHRGAVVSD
jgi:hypothetical protein